MSETYLCDVTLFDVHKKFYVYGIKHQTTSSPPLQTMHILLCAVTAVRVAAETEGLIGLSPAVIGIHAVLGCSGWLHL